MQTCLPTEYFIFVPWAVQSLTSLRLLQTAHAVYLHEIELQPLAFVSVAQ